MNFPPFDGAAAIQAAGAIYPGQAPGKRRTVGGAPTRVALAA
jgi:hypothetical protein